MDKEQGHRWSLQLRDAGQTAETVPVPEPGLLGHSDAERPKKRGRRGMEWPASPLGKAGSRKSTSPGTRPAAHAAAHAHAGAPDTRVLFWEGGACKATPKGRGSQETEEKETRPIDKKWFLLGT